MSRFRTSAIGAATVALALALFAVPTAASAHDQLLSSDPADGSSLEASPETVRLDFSSDIMAEGAEIVVIDASYTDHATGDVVVDGSTASIAVTPGLPAAGYQARWRVVSSDGHPISGIVSFTVGGASAMPLPADGAAEPAATRPAATPSTIATDDVSAQSAATPERTSDAAAPVAESPVTTEPGTNTGALVGGAIALVAVVALVVVVLRRRSTKGAAGSATTGSPAPGPNATDSVDGEETR